MGSQEIWFSLFYWLSNRQNRQSPIKTNGLPWLLLLGFFLRFTLALQPAGIALQLGPYFGGAKHSCSVSLWYTNTCRDIRYDTHCRLHHNYILNNVRMWAHRAIWTNKQHIINHFYFTLKGFPFHLSINLFILGIGVLWSVKLRVISVLPAVKSGQSALRYKNQGGIILAVGYQCSC